MIIKNQQTVFSQYATCVKLDRHYITVSCFSVGNMSHIVPTNVIIGPHLVCLMVVTLSVSQLLIHAAYRPEIFMRSVEEVD